MMTQPLSMPNSISSVSQRWNERKFHAFWPFFMLISRCILFLLVQCLFALAFAMAGNPAPWQESIHWWIPGVTISNFICIGLLAFLAKKEGITFLDLYRVKKHHVLRELLVLLGLFLIGGPLAYFPNPLLATMLWGDPQIPFSMMFLPLPAVVVYVVLVLFPLTHIFAELPTYFLYSMPRLDAITRSRWLSIGLPILFLSLQHIFIPFIPDGRFILWRALMFLPFAIFVGILLRWRPQATWYILILHGLMDLSLPLFIPIQ
jgi:hypothetical protein